MRIKVQPRKTTLSNDQVKLLSKLSSGRWQHYICNRQEKKKDKYILKKKERKRNNLVSTTKKYIYITKFIERFYYKTASLEATNEKINKPWYQ
jgi:hypothetical protein